VRSEGEVLVVDRDSLNQIDGNVGQLMKSGCQSGKGTIECIAVIDAES
jgi:hypothetical protein